MKGYEIPEFSRQSKGLPIINLLPLENDEKITSMIQVENEENSNKYLMFFTKDGLTKRTRIEEFENIRNIIHIVLNKGEKRKKDEKITHISNIFNDDV